MTKINLGVTPCRLIRLLRVFLILGCFYYLPYFHMQFSQSQLCKINNSIYVSSSVFVLVFKNKIKL